MDKNIKTKHKGKNVIQLNKPWTIFRFYYEEICDISVRYAKYDMLEMSKVVSE
jgi:hypothetical protein